jgi:nucleoside-diphosphate-sugar epimerase
MKILITGAAGFIGGHLQAELIAANHEVVGIDRPDGDLRHAPVAAHLIGCHKPDLVVHLAAKVGRLFGEDDVMETVADNAGMTALVAKACGDLGVRMVYASTSEVYGDGAEHTWEEADIGLALPHNAYGLSKRHGEDYCRLYASEGLTIWRISMPYGGGLPAGRGRAAIINMLHQALNKQTIPVHRGAERSWCYVADTVRGMRHTIEDTDGGVFNVGRDDASVSMLHVAMMACELTGAPLDLIEEVDAPARQTVVKRLATGKLRSLGWEPRVELEEGMTRTLDWVKGLAAVAA